MCDDSTHRFMKMSTNIMLMKYETEESLVPDFRYLGWDVEGAVATVRLERPPVNAVSQEMYREIALLFSDIDIIGTGIKVIVLTGEGRHFCAGNDLDEFATLTSDNADARMAEVRAAFYAIQDCPVPVIAAVHGAALGTGLAIAASCDFIVAAKDARFGTPEVAVGIMGGAKHLTRLVPQPWVRWMYFTAQTVSADQLFAIGGVVAVVSQENVLREAQVHAGRIARHSGPVIRMAKYALNTIESMELQAGYKFEQGLTREIAKDPDSQESRLSTLERRPPRYPSEVRS